MTKAIISGIEKFCAHKMNKNNPNLFQLGATDGGFEILLGGRISDNNVRRFAFCKREDDARVIIEALRYAVANGVT